MLIITFLILSISRPVIRVGNSAILEDPSSLSLVIVVDDTFSNINDYSETNDNSFENKQILCLYCHRMKTNYRKKYKTLTALEVNQFKPQSMEID